MTIDLRSDTFTQPTPAMREAMWAAEVGDDVFAEDPSINTLQEYAAKLFGHEAALFCPSGTQTNQIAMGCHTSPGDEVICSDMAHIYLYEGGGLAWNSGLSARTVHADRGLILAQHLEGQINPPDAHYARTTLVSIENTVNKGGGAVYRLQELQDIHRFCKSNGLAVHLDGARIFNAMVATGDEPSAIGACFDSLSVCLSKGLGAPVGSLLIGDKSFIKKAHRRRKSMGGGMRQAGFLAAAGLFAMQNHVDRLLIDHMNALAIADALKEVSWVKEVTKVETNIVIFQLIPGLSSALVVNALGDRGIKCFAFGPDKLRFVTHLDNTPEQVNFALETIRKSKAGIL
jgi:threonine aldolase